MTGSLELREVEVFAGSRRVAGPVSLVHQTGSLLWLTGENGAGKSSLLRVLARRSRHRGQLVLTPAPGLRDICYYAPVMRFPGGIRVQDWLRLHRRMELPASAAQSVESLLPAGVQGELTRLSTGEAKRLQLWSLLRVARTFYFLDEPFEHLSPSAKQNLRVILAALAASALVVVATNQDIPSDIPARVLELD